MFQTSRGAQAASVQRGAFHDQLSSVEQKIVEIDQDIMSKCYDIVKNQSETKGGFGYDSLPHQNLYSLRFIVNIELES